MVCELQSPFVTASTQTGTEKKKFSSPTSFLCVTCLCSEVSYLHSPHQACSAAFHICALGCSGTKMEELPHPFSARPVVTEQHRAVLVRREGPWGLQGSWQRGQLLAEHCSRSHFRGKHSATCVQQTITSHFPCPGVRCTDMEQSEAGSAPNISVLRGSPEKKTPSGSSGARVLLPCPGAGSLTVCL